MITADALGRLTAHTRDGIPRGDGGGRPAALRPTSAGIDA